MEPDEIYDDYTFWRHEGLNPIATVETYAALLLDERLGELNKKQKEWLEVILRNSKEARKRWDDFGEHLQARHHLQRNENPPDFLANIIQHALSSNLDRYKYFTKPEVVKIKIPASLKAVKISAEFENVFFYLLAPVFKLMDEKESAKKLTPKISARLASHDMIHIEIYSAVDHFHIPQGEPGDSPYPNVDIDLAYFILKQKEISLHVEIISGENEAVTMVQFSFELPIWRDGAV